MQAKNIIVQLLFGFIAAAMNVCRFASLSLAHAFTPPRQRRACRGLRLKSWAWACGSQVNTAGIDEFAEHDELADHKVATLGFEEPTPGFEELVLGFVQ